MNHSFNVLVATKYGMLEAVLMEHLNFWIEKNRANEVNFYDGYYWTYSSIKALSELFPYASQKTISRALHHLMEEGLVITGNYNKSAYDRTTWYALTEKAISVLKGIDNNQCEKNTDVEIHNSKTSNAISQNDDIHCPETSDSISRKSEMDLPEMGNAFVKRDTSICPKGKMEEPKRENGFVESDTTIPDINTDISTDNNLTVSKDTVCQTDVCRIVAQWNALSDCGIKPVIKISPETKRYDMLKARIRTYGVEKVLEAIEHIRGSSFLCGENNRGWTITFDWFIRPNNFPKVLEGNYDRTTMPTTENTEKQKITSSGYSQELLDRLAGGIYG